MLTSSNEKMLLSTRKSSISFRFVTIKFVIVISLRLGYSLDVLNMIDEIYIYKLSASSASSGIVRSSSSMMR